MQGELMHALIDGNAAQVAAILISVHYNSVQ
jgi:hypothetical protein